MKNNKGQALVEFIIVLPIFLLLIISIIDFGNIISKKYALENDLDIVYEMYEDNKLDEINRYIRNKKINISYEDDGDFTNIVLQKDIKVMSPMLFVVFGDKYEIKVVKSVYDE